MFLIVLLTGIITTTGSKYINLNVAIGDVYEGFNTYDYRYNFFDYEFSPRNSFQLYKNFNDDPTYPIINWHSILDSTTVNCTAKEILFHVQYKFKMDIYEQDLLI